MIFDNEDEKSNHVLALEVTPGLLAGAEPNAHQFYVTICLWRVIKWR